jgi:hypothetical protein
MSKRKAAVAAPGWGDVTSEAISGGKRKRTDESCFEVPNLAAGGDIAVEALALVPVGYVGQQMGPVLGHVRAMAAGVSGRLSALVLLVTYEGAGALVGFAALLADVRPDLLGLLLELDDSGERLELEAVHEVRPCNIKDWRSISKGLADFPGLLCAMGLSFSIHWLFYGNPIGDRLATDWRPIGDRLATDCLLFYAFRRMCKLAKPDTHSFFTFARLFKQLFLITFSIIVNVQVMDSSNIMLLMRVLVFSNL